ncbi:MAG: hypothetical protein AAF724_10970 [Pseudomonadota bacterium]
MKKITKLTIAAAAIVATVMIPASGAFAKSNTVIDSARSYSLSSSPYHYKKGPKAYHPRGYRPHKPPVIVNKRKNNGAALGILGFAAGALVGSAIANNS